MVAYACFRRSTVYVPLVHVGGTHSHPSVPDDLQATGPYTVRDPKPRIVCAVCIRFDYCAICGYVSARWLLLILSGRWQP